MSMHGVIEKQWRSSGPMSRKRFQSYRNDTGRFRQRSRHGSLLGLVHLYDIVRHILGEVSFLASAVATGGFFPCAVSPLATKEREVDGALV
jgi:hypothetical protein